MSFKEFGFYKTFLLLSLYATQFIGYAFFTEAFIAILRKNGVSLEYLGLLYMLGIIWVVRFLWAPLIDKFSLSKTSHYKAWVSFFQALMVLILFISSFADVKSSASLILLLAIFFVFCSASQDTALDALVFKDISLKFRPLSNSLKFSGEMLGLMLGGGLGLIIYDYLGWNYTMFLLCVVTLNSLIWLYFFKEKPKNAHEKSHFSLKNYLSFWKGKRRVFWLVFIMLYPANISIAYALISPILVDMGWKLAKIGFYIHIVGYLIGALISLSSPYMMKRFGKKKVLIIGSVGQVLGLMLYLVPLNFTIHESLVTLIVGITFSFYTISFATISTFMMNECSAQNPATEFAMQNGVMMFASIVFASLAMALSGSLGYAKVILLFCTLGAMVAFMATKLDLKEG